MLSHCSAVWIFVPFLCYVSLPHRAVDWSVLCDRGISMSCLLFMLWLIVHVMI